MEKEGLVHDISVYLGRQRGGGVPDRKNELEAFSCSFCPKCWSFECSLSKKLTAPSWRECTKCLDIASSSLLFSPVSATSHLLYIYYGYIRHADLEADVHPQCSSDELLNAHSLFFFSCLSSDCPCRAIHFIYSVHHINFPIPEMCTINQVLSQWNVSTVELWEAAQWPNQWSPILRHELKCSSVCSCVSLRSISLFFRWSPTTMAVSVTSGTLLVINMNFFLVLKVQIWHYIIF